MASLEAISTLGGLTKVRINRSHCGLTTAKTSKRRGSWCGNRLWHLSIAVKRSHFCKLHKKQVSMRTHCEGPFPSLGRGHMSEGLQSLSFIHTPINLWCSLMGNQWKGQGMCSVLWLTREGHSSSEGGQVWEAPWKPRPGWRGQPAGTGTVWLGTSHSPLLSVGFLSYFLSLRKTAPPSPNASGTLHDWVLYL